MAEVKKADLKSMNIPEDKLRQLKDVFPEAFAEGLKVDLEKLKIAIGKDAELGKERFGMNWPGKTDCFKIIQAPSVATLIPAKEESVNFDSTENLFIEGDNLEVLKLLQKSYYGKVKVIYIDPPYNTGSDFIYPDDYAENLDTYLRYTRQIDDVGRKYSTNAETDGRFHSKWMTMMYPRLYLAKNLLKDDGVIFISIDDNEQSNLKKICDEIFGEENFVAQLVWKKKYTGGKHTKYYVDFHEYVLVYTRSKETIKEILIDRPEEEKDKFTESDEYLVERGKYYLRPLKSNLEERKTLVYPIECPDGKKITTQWLVSKETFERMLQEKRVEFRQKRDGEYQIYKKYYEKDGDGKVKPPSLIEDFPNTEGKFELKELFNIEEGRDNVFYTVKPKNLIKYLLEPFLLSTNEIVLDFFAGSATTAHAVFDLNLANATNHRFVCVQLPEEIDPEFKNDQFNFRTVADIGKERIRRVIKKIGEERAQTSKGEKSLFEDRKNLVAQDLGFKVFKLAQSNFKVWEGSSEPKKEAVEKQLEMHVDHINPKSSQEDILFELLLKAGFELTTKIEKVSMAEKVVYSIEGGLMLICLEKELTKEVIKAMAEKNPSRVICLDEGFAGNDQLKTNAVQIMKSKGVEDFRTV